MKTRIHINKNLIQQNRKNGTKFPVCRIEIGNQTFYGDWVDIHGSSVLKYSPDEPLNCGAVLWIETESVVTIHGKTTYKEMKQ